MSIKLNTANPIDNNANAVCKTISLVPSSFMGRSLPSSPANLENPMMQPAPGKLEAPEPPQCGAPYPLTGWRRSPKNRPISSDFLFKTSRQG
jgi:hypothetical protein